MKKSEIMADSILSQEISSLLYKKLFSKSKYLHLNKKVPEDFFDIQSKDNYPQKSSVKNYVFCVLLLLAYLINIFKLTQINDKKYILFFSLTKQQAIRNGSIKPLHTFLKTKNLIENSKFLVLIEVRNVLWNKTYESTKTTIDIPLRIYSDNFSIIKKIKCWISMCSRFFKITKLQRANKTMFLVMKEHVFDEVVYQNFDLDLIEKLITTQSNFAYQPLIFEYDEVITKRLMLWYSSNSIPLNYKKNNVQRFEANPAVYKNMKIDEHWVWTEKHKSYLRNFTRAQILVKKSLMFYEQERQKTLNNTFDVVIFDVTPKKDVNISNFSIYTTDEMIRFITEILKCVELIKTQFTLEVRVALKHKRESSKHTPPEYSQFVQSKIRNKEISIVNSNQNLYDLIESSKLVVGFPFTSPVIIGQELNKPSIFYCSSSLLKLAPRSESDSFLQSEKSLYAYMTKVLVN